MRTICEIVRPVTDSPGGQPPSSYPLARGLAAQVLGRSAIASAAAVAAVAVVKATGAPAWLLYLLLALAVLPLAVVAAAALLVVRPPTVLRLDAEGFSVHLLRVVGARAGRWSQLRDVATSARASGPVLVLRHQDGDTTGVPLGLLDAARVDVERDVHDRLNAAHGYRRIR